MNTYTCTHCGGTFEDYPSNRKGHTNYFCSNSCKNDWMRGRFTGENSPTWKGGATTPMRCEQCNIEYQALTKQIKRFPHAFCSKACKYAWMAEHQSGENSPTWKGGPVSLTCAACGKTFERERRAIRPNSVAVCDLKCRSVWMSKNLVGAAHPRWAGGKAEYYGPNWMAQARAARKRDGHQCRVCGERKGQKGYKALDVHHIRPFKSFGYVYRENDHYLAANDLANLVTLCPRCHLAIENGSLVFKFE